MVSFARLQVYFLVALALVGVVYPLYLMGAPASLASFDLQRIGGDFYGFLLASKLAVAGKAAQLYDLDWFYAQVAPNVVFGSGLYAFVHPPSLLVFLVPLSGLTYVQAYSLWMGAGGLFSFLASYSRKAPLRALTFFVLAPATLVNLFYGQFGMLAGALLYAGLRALDKRPVWAGIFLGCVSIKPELFLLVPVILIARRNLMSLCVCFATVAFLVDVSAVFFGSSLWWLYLETVPSLLASVMERGQASFFYLMPSAFGAARALGFSAVSSYWVQLPFTALAVVVAFWLFRGKREPTSRNLAFSLCVMLATPFVFIWDYAMLTPALYLYATRTGLFDERAHSPLFEPVLLFGVYLLPLVNIALAAHNFPIAPIFLVLALGALLMRIHRGEHDYVGEGDKLYLSEQES